MSDPTNPENDFLAQMREDFLVESGEILDRLGVLFTQLEQAATPELVNGIFREVHTVKGTAGFVGLRPVNAFAHKMEDLFGEVRAGRLEVSRDLVDVAFSGLQILVAMREDVAHGGNGDIDAKEVLDRLAAALKGETPAPPTAAPPRAPAAGSGSGSGFAVGEAQLRVRTETLDAMMDLVGELITARNALQATAESLRDESVVQHAATINRLARQLQIVVTEVRLVPVERLFTRFTPVVRNLARERDVQVRLEVEGGDTPLDRTIAEQMFDPLVHLLRNAVDHGLEPVEERRRADKPDACLIRLSAARRGDDVILRIEDDGRGIDPARVRRVAVERGVLTTDESVGLSDEQAVRVIFAPGFSTASEITDVSGRGVGMDVVLQSVRRLRGSIDVDTAVGRGTTFTIALPLTLAILQVLLVRVGGHIYALPLHAVRETLVLAPDEVQSLHGGEVALLRGAALPVRRLGRLLGHESDPAVFGPLPAVVMSLGRGSEILTVDDLVGKQQMVVKPLSPYLGAVPGVEGAAVLPDGRVAPILDVEGLST